MNIRKGKSGFMRWLLLPAAVAISWPTAFVFAQEAAQGPLPDQKSDCADESKRAHHKPAAEDPPESSAQADFSFRDR